MALQCNSTIRREPVPVENRGTFSALQSSTLEGREYKNHRLEVAVKAVGPPTILFREQMAKWQGWCRRDYVPRGGLQRLNTSKTHNYLTCLGDQEAEGEQKA